MTNLNGVTMSESIGNLAASLAKVNKTLKNIAKDIEGAKGKNDKKARYKYFDIAQLLEHVRLPLAEVGLSVMQFNINGESAEEVGCITMILHESGEYIQSPPTYAKIDNPLNQYGNKNMTDVQAYGSVISYVRRYSLCSVLGIAGDKDDNDGARIETNYNDYQNGNLNKGNNVEYYNNVYQASQSTQTSQYQQKNNYQQNNNYQPKNQGNVANAPTESQVKYLKDLLKTHGYTDDVAYTNFCTNLIGSKKQIAELTKFEAKQMIEVLKNQTQTHMS